MAAAKSSARRPPVLVLGTGITALGVLRILSRDHLNPLMVDSTDPLLRRSRWYRAADGAPAAFDDRTFVEWLTNSSFDRAVLMPCSDHWVRRVANLDPSLRERFPASVSPSAALAKFVDKGQFAELLRETGTAHPWSKIVETQADLDAAPEHVFTSAILKPRDSQRFTAHFGVKALHIGSRADAARHLRTVTAAGFPVILQEYIPGPATNHYFVDGFVDRFGTVQAIFVRQRLRMYPLDFGNSTFMKSVPPAAAAGAVSAISRMLQRAGYRGMFSAEFKLDPRDGVFKVIEVNARAWWYVEFAARCGADLCRLAYADALAEPLETQSAYAVGKRLVYPYYDFFGCAEMRQRGGRSMVPSMLSWLGAMQPVFQFKDPWPGLRALGSSMRSFVGKRLRKTMLRRN